MHGTIASKHFPSFQVCIARAYSWRLCPPSVPTHGWCARDARHVLARHRTEPNPTQPNCDTSQHNRWPKTFKARRTCSAFTAGPRSSTAARKVRGLPRMMPGWPSWWDRLARRSGAASLRSCPGAPASSAASAGTTTSTRTSARCPGRSTRWEMRQVYSAVLR